MPWMDILQERQKLSHILGKKWLDPAADFIVIIAILVYLVVLINSQYGFLSFTCADIFLSLVLQFIVLIMDT